MNGKRIRAFYVNATAWNFGDDVQPHIVAARERQAAEFDAWLDRERAAARREGQAEALREAAREMQDGIGEVYDPARVDYEQQRHEAKARRAWLYARADRIENGEGQ